jgi:hypothetical protein
MFFMASSTFFMDKYEPDGAASWEISPDVWRDPPLLRVSRVTENVPPRAPPALAEVLMVWISRSSTAVVVTSWISFTSIVAVVIVCTSFGPVFVVVVRVCTSWVPGSVSHSTL